MIRLRRVARFQRGAGFPHDKQGNESGDLPFFKVGDFSLAGNERYLTNCTHWVSSATARELGAIPVPPGSVLLPKIGAALLGNARRIATVDCVFDNNVLAIVPSDVHPEYLAFWLDTVDLAELANPGPIPSLNDSAAMDLLLPVSDIREQRSIADLLDAETARVDALIAKKRRMIELLDERFSAELDVALGPDSGASPRRLRYWVGKVGSGKTPRGGSGTYVAQGVAFLRSQNVSDGGIVLDEVAYIDAQVDEEMASTRVRAGDVLINITGASIGRTAVVPASLSRANVSQHVCIVRPAAGDSGVIALALRCRSTQEQIRAAQVGGNRDGLTFEQVKELVVWLPPNQNAQRSLATRLEAADSRRRQGVGLLQRQIDLLHEHRQARIAEAVNGQVEAPSAA